jgi:hypothetical protein
MAGAIDPLLATCQESIIFGNAMTSTVQGNLRPVPQVPLALSEFSITM